MPRFLITGANRGIGLELCKQLKEREEEVIAVCRKSSPALEALGVEIQSGVELTDLSSIQKLAQDLKGKTIDVLINNAGILKHDHLGKLDKKSFQEQFEVNAVAPLLFTEALLPCFKSGSKIVMITSRMGSIGDNSSGGYYGYRMSKAALNMISVSLAQDLKSQGIAVFILHPGMVATDMTDKSGIPPAEAARNLLNRIDQLGMSETGTFWHANGERLPW